jgi:hypothetical protein
MAAIVIPYAPRQAFKPLHNRTQRWAVVVAHRRAGKTVACVNELIKAAITFKGNDGRFGYVAPFYSQAKSVAWDYLKRYSSVIPGITVNESELRIDYPNGSRIRLFGADNADALRGLFFDGIVADEYGDWKPSVWGYVIRPALADRGGWAVIIGTPKGRNQFFEIYQYAGISKEWLCLTIRASESGLLPKSELDALREELTEDAWRQEMECDFDAAIPGAYYGKEISQARIEGRITNVPYDPEWSVYTAWDLGFSDDTAIWWFQTIGGEIRVIDYYSTNGEDIEHYADVILNKPYKYGKHYLPHDARAKTLASGGKSTIEQLAKHLGISKMTIAPELGLQDGIQAARLAFPKVWFDKVNCIDGVDALSLYQREYDEDKKCFRDKPRHDWTSHTADAFRYMCIAYREERKAKKEDETRYPIQGTERGIVTAPLDELWDTAPKRSGRI